MNTYSIRNVRIAPKWVPIAAALLSVTFVVLAIVCCLPLRVFKFFTGESMGILSIISLFLLLVCILFYLIPSMIYCFIPNSKVSVDIKNKSVKYFEGQLIKSFSVRTFYEYTISSIRKIKVKSRGIVIYGEINAIVDYGRRKKYRKINIPRVFENEEMLITELRKLEEVHR